MNNVGLRYYGHRFPPGIISYAVWVYHRFCLSFRDVEDLLAERRITVSYEAIRIWCQRLRPGYGRSLKRHQGRLADSWHLDGVFIRIRGQQKYLWRAVDQDGDVIDILVQPRRHQRAAERFLRLLRGQGKEAFQIITDKLRSCSAGMRATRARSRTTQNVMPAIASKPRISLRGKGSGKCAASNLLGQAQRFLSLHGVVQNLFRLGCHL